jgi:formate hydrogenlyase transcriptional activator
MNSESAIAWKVRDTDRGCRSPGNSSILPFRTSAAVDTVIPVGRYLDTNDQDGESGCGFEDIVGSSAALRGVLQQVRTVGPTDSTVLIEGETGTGKELIAQAIHKHSRRRDRPFVKLNCAAIPMGLLESELFGHEKGAFTGAVAQRIGRFEAASGGTLFLDEVGDIPLELQAKLLRVLQEQEFERLGSSYTRRVDVRVVAATNQNLSRLVGERLFRMDLFYRLNVFPIAVPALRHRTDDIPALVAHFVKRYSQRMGKHVEAVSSDDMKALESHAWPGNIRELQNLVERSVILTDGDVLKIPALASENAAPQNPVTLEEAERDHILNALRETNWVVGGPVGAAARLGVKRTTLIGKMRKRGVSRAMAFGTA